MARQDFGRVIRGWISQTGTESGWGDLYFEYGRREHQNGFVGLERALVFRG
jgi:hypothetical protein